MLLFRNQISLGFQTIYSNVAGNELNLLTIQTVWKTYLIFAIESSLYCLYQEHLRTFPYHNIELYMNQPMRDMSVAGLLESVPAHGELLMQIALVFFNYLKY